jgi:hypothetical protein
MLDSAIRIALPAALIDAMPAVMVEMIAGERLSEGSSRSKRPSSSVKARRWTPSWARAPPRVRCFRDGGTFSISG